MKAEQSVQAWKQRTKREAAKLYGLKSEKIRIVPEDTKQPIKATWQKIDKLVCPLNRKFYRVYWVRTDAEFKQGLRLEA